jgi:hypothetical protein
MNDPTLAPTVASGLFFCEPPERFATGHPARPVAAAAPADRRRPPGRLRGPRR